MESNSEQRTLIFHFLSVSQEPNRYSFNRRLITGEGSERIKGRVGQAIDGNWDVSLYGGSVRAFSAAASFCDKL